MKLYVDDLRELPECEPDCICARDYEDAIWQLSVHSFDYVSLDYDLGTSSRGTGLDILKWIVSSGKKIPNINIHSTHPIGIKMMVEYCKNFLPDTKITTHSLY